MNRTRAAWRTAGLHSPRKRFPMAFSLPSRPDLEQLRGAFSHEDRTATFEGQREGNQAAGISEISGFAARRLAGRAAQLLRTLFPLIAEKPSRAGTRAPSRAWNDPRCSNRRVFNSKAGR
jgi:hypothetical protein